MRTEKHALSKALFDEMTAVLTERGLLLRQGTIVDATLIAAPPSTKNRTKSRDGEMKQTRKGGVSGFPCAGGRLIIRPPWL